MTNYAEVFPPGEFLKEELEERSWSQNDLARIMDKSVRLVSEVVNAKRTVTPETAKALGAAFGTSPQYWMNLESAWQLFQLSKSDDDIGRRSKLYSKFPVREILKRGWIEDSESIETLESRFCQLYRVNSVDSDIALAANFRNSVDEANDLQVAWLYRCWQIAEKLVVPKFTTRKLEHALSQIKALLISPENVVHVPKILGECGIRFVLVEGMKGAKADGVCFWLDKDSPVIALSMRYGRLDWFWFTLIHELRHVANRDGVKEPVMDVDLINREPADGVEKRADEEAAEFLLPQRSVKDFVVRVAPLYSTKRIIGFSKNNGVHPALLVGRIQHMGEIPFSQFRYLLAEIRNQILPSAIVDGWGYSIF